MNDKIKMALQQLDMVEVKGHNAIPLTSAILILEEILRDSNQKNSPEEKPEKTSDKK